MPIPKEILAVERPKNTVVFAYGKNRDRYGVKARVGCRRRDGKNRPVNGPTVGHIVDGRYVPLKKLTVSSPDLKDYASVACCDGIFSDMIGKLDAEYDHSDSLRIYCMAVLRVCRPGIADCELKEAYEESFLSELYPGVALSRNTVSSFHEKVGKNLLRIRSFMRKRAAEVEGGHHLLVDGTLKSDESSVNTLSDFSRKARTKGSRDISVIYAFDLEKGEPVCSQCYPGNMLDMTAYSDFIERNGIKTGIIVADKGFPQSQAAKCFEGNPDLHFLNPVRRNSTLASAHGMYSYDGVLREHPAVTYRKAKVGGKDRWLYSFRDSARAAKEERDYLSRTADGFDGSELKSRQERFGTVVLESDLDMTPEEIYSAYSRRWEIETVMRYYKQSCEFDETRVHDDYSVYSTEFVNFLSSLLTYRLLNLFERNGLLREYTYGEIMRMLRRAKKIRTEEKEGFALVRLNPSTMKVLETLGLIQAEPAPEKRRRGRPKKSDI